ncbi:MAG: glycosyl hydrolase [Burkholderiales bacterium]|nr:glycosyl hydrolase [Burkholderiales bacterium]
MSHKIKALGLIVLSLGVCLALPASAASSITLTHVHGLSYSADGKLLFVPSHDGIATYSRGKWNKTAGPENDYMGFSSTKQFFYSSGHPKPGSGLVNPFGLIKSSDGGQTWQKLGLEGEADFHLMATSYGTNAVYVSTHVPNSRMSKPGIYSTANDGFSWKHADGRGLEGSLLNLAVHPSNNQIVAAGTKTGLFLSSNGGDNFKRLASGEQVLAAFFDLDEKQLWFSSYAGKPTLTRLDWNSGKKTAVSLPPLAEDAVANIAQNPANRNEYAIATFKRNIYLTKDLGKTWAKIADQGQTL